ncbi:MAG: hypothetical protein IJ223_04060 [Clostridia bacterium]|nr:hypothetical protein [Clostridia bacterium]
MKKVNKMCSFYVNNWHLTMMILPYIKNKIEKKENVIIISNENLENNIKTILDKLNLKEELKENIKRIGCNIMKQEKITEEISMFNNILIVGKEEYINDVNKKIENKKLRNNVNIIDCYEVMDFNKNIEHILKNHKKLINTSGERSIEEAFDGFGKKEVI